MSYEFSIIHGYRMYIILIIAKLVTMSLAGIVKSRRDMFWKISKAISHIGLIVMLSDLMCQVHAAFCTLGDNIRECKYTGIATVEALLHRIDFPGWVAYIILFAFFVIILMLESGRYLEQKPYKRTLVLVGLAVVCVIIANFLNSFTVYEYCALECQGISEALVNLISRVVYGEPYYFYDCTNIASLLAIPLYITLVNYLCIPRMESEKAIKSLKILKIISNVLLILCIIHCLRDIFFGFGSFAYTPMVVIAFAIRLQLANEIKELEENDNISHKK